MTEPVVVIGAGLSGLSCAFDLARAGHDVTVLEAAPHAGGVVRTSSERGYLFEDGPNTVLASAPGFRQLVHDIGLEERLVASRSEAKDRFLYFRGRLRPIPQGPGAFLSTPLLSARAKLRLATEPLRKHVPQGDTELEPSLGRFLEERLGKEPAQVLAGAFVRGVYAAELDELGAASAFPKLWSLAEEHGGLLRGMLARRRQPKSTPAGRSFARGSLLSFERGLSELVDALVAKLGASVRLGQPVARLERRSAGWRAVTQDGRGVDATHVVLAVPARASAELLAPVVPASFPLDVLNDVRHAELTLVHLGLKREELALPEGFGYLVPPGGEAVTGSKPPGVLGTIFTSCLFDGRAPSGAQAVSSFYRTQDLGSDANDDARIVTRAAHDLARAVGSARAPDVELGLVRRWSQVIPRYAPGHARRVDALRTRLADETPGIELAGNFVAGVSVDQVIARGREVARTLLEGREGRSSATRTSTNGTFDQAVLSRNEAEAR